jgi:hypothetical protein
VNPYRDHNYDALLREHEDLKLAHARLRRRVLHIWLGRFWLIFLIASSIGIGDFFVHRYLGCHACDEARLEAKAGRQETDVDWAALVNAMATTWQTGVELWRLDLLECHKALETCKSLRP